METDINVEVGRMIEALLDQAHQGLRIRALVVATIVAHLTVVTSLPLIAHRHGQEISTGHPTNLLELVMGFHHLHRKEGISSRNRRIAGEGRTETHTFQAIQKADTGTIDYRWKGMSVPEMAEEVRAIPRILKKAVLRPGMTAEETTEKWPTVIEAATG